MGSNYNAICVNNIFQVGFNRSGKTKSQNIVLL